MQAAAEDLLLLCQERLEERDIPQGAPFHRDGGDTEFPHGTHWRKRLLARANTPAEASSPSPLPPQGHQKPPSLSPSQGQDGVDEDAASLLMAAAAHADAHATLLPEPGTQQPPLRRARIAAASHKAPGRMQRPRDEGADDGAAVSSGSASSTSTSGGASGGEEVNALLIAVNGHGREANGEGHASINLAMPQRQRQQQHSLQQQAQHSAEPPPAPSLPIKRSSSGGGDGGRPPRIPIVSKKPLKTLMAGCTTGRVRRPPAPPLSGSRSRSAGAAGRAPADGRGAATDSPAPHPPATDTAAEPEPAGSGGHAAATDLMSVPFLKSELQARLGYAPRLPLEVELRLSLHGRAQPLQGQQGQQGQQRPGPQRQGTGGGLRGLLRSHADKMDLLAPHAFKTAIGSFLPKRRDGEAREHFKLHKGRAFKYEWTLTAGPGGAAGSTPVLALDLQPSASKGRRKLAAVGAATGASAAVTGAGPGPGSGSGAGGRGAKAGRAAHASHVGSRKRSRLTSVSEGPASRGIIDMGDGWQPSSDMQDMSYRDTVLKSVQRKYPSATLQHVDLYYSFSQLRSKSEDDGAGFDKRFHVFDPESRALAQLRSCKEVAQFICGHLQLESGQQAASQLGQPLPVPPQQRPELHAALPPPVLDPGPQPPPSQPQPQQQQPLPSRDPLPPAQPLPPLGTLPPPAPRPGLRLLQSPVLLTPQPPSPLAPPVQQPEESRSQEQRPSQQPPADSGRGGGQVLEVEGKQGHQRGQEDVSLAASAPAAGCSRAEQQQRRRQHVQEGQGRQRHQGAAPDAGCQHGGGGDGRGGGQTKEGHEGGCNGAEQQQQQNQQVQHQQERQQQHQQSSASDAHRQHNGSGGGRGGDQNQGDREGACSGAEQQPQHQEVQHQQERQQQERQHQHQQSLASDVHRQRNGNGCGDRDQEDPGEATPAQEPTRPEAGLARPGNPEHQHQHQHQQHQHQQQQHQQHQHQQHRFTLDVLRQLASTLDAVQAIPALGTDVQRLHAAAVAVVLGAGMLHHAAVRQLLLRAPAGLARVLPLLAGNVSVLRAGEVERMASELGLQAGTFDLQAQLLGWAVRAAAGLGAGPGGERDGAGGGSGSGSDGGGGGGGSSGGSSPSGLDEHEVRYVQSMVPALQALVPRGSPESGHLDLLAVLLSVYRQVRRQGHTVPALAACLAHAQRGRVGEEREERERHTGRVMRLICRACAAESGLSALRAAVKVALERGEGGSGGGSSGGGSEGAEVWGSVPDEVFLALSSAEVQRAKEEVRQRRQQQRQQGQQQNHPTAQEQHQQQGEQHQLQRQELQRQQLQERQLQRRQQLQQTQAQQRQQLRDRQHEETSSGRTGREQEETESLGSEEAALLAVDDAALVAGLALHAFGESDLAAGIAHVLKLVHSAAGGAGAAEQRAGLPLPTAAAAVAAGYRPPAGAAGESAGCLLLDLLEGVEALKHDRDRGDDG